MIIITDGLPQECGCEKDCDWEQKMKQAYNRAVTSVNKVRTPEGEEYVPDGEGTIVLPLGGGSADLEKQVEALEASQEAQDSEITAIKAKDTAQDSDLSQLKISDAEHTDAISSLETASDAQARKIASIEAKDASQDSEISAIKTKNTQQDTEIDGLSKSVVSDLVATFDNDSRKLSLSIEREQAASIDAVVTIPAGSTGGGDYSAGDGIEISSSNVISVDKATVALKTDISDMETKTNANATFAKKTDISDMETKTHASATYATKTAISDMETKTNANATFAKKTDISDMETKTNANATFAKKTEISDMETKTNANATFATKSTVTQIQNAVGDCFNAVGLGSDGKSLDFTAVDGQVNNIAIPSSGGSGTKVTIYTSQNNITSIDGFLQFCNQYGSISDNITLSFITNDGEKINFNGYIQLVSEDIVLLNGTGFCWIAEASYGSLAIDSDNLYTLSFTRSVNTYTYKVFFFDIVMDSFNDFTGNSMTVEDLRLWHYSNN